MKLLNSTPFPADIQIGSTTDSEQLGTVACKVSYQWADDGELFALPDEAMWPIAKAPAQYEGVMLMPDLDFRRGGIDVLVFGPAVAPQGKPVREMRVGVASGRFVRQYDVIGDRRWQKQEKPDKTVEWRMTPPAEFVTMPLVCENAFGGTAQMGHARMPFSMNPLGKGFVPDAAFADGAALPNIERIGQRIARPQDQPVPACLHKPQGGLLLPAQGESSWAAVGESKDNDLLVRTLVAQTFQQAPPDFVCPRGALGPSLALKGFHAEGLQQMALPPERALVQRQGPVVYVETGMLRSAFPLAISAMLVLAAQRTLVITFAASFRYLMRPGDARRAVLQWHGATEFAMELAR
jgi:hypothetical protein